MKNRKWYLFLVTFIAVISLALISCAQENPATTTPGQTTTTGPTKTTTPKPDTTKPQYGGSLSLVLTAEPTFDLLQLGKAWPHLQSHEYLWDGDWTRGNAGGYGTKEFAWSESTNIPDLNVGMVAEKISWVVNADTQQVVTTIKVRPGIKFAMDPENAASRLAAGREVTADDVKFCMDEFHNNPDSMNYKLFPTTRGLFVEKTGPSEVQLTLPFKEHLAASMRVLGLTVIYPPEVYKKYGAAFNDPKNDVGTGPYIITDYVSGSMVSLKRNPNYWMTNPIGPGKGDQLPYIDTMKYYILVDVSTREAALRTAKLDQLGGFDPEEADNMLKSAPDLMSAPAATWSVSPAYIRVDKEPFTDVRVRRALFMATDFNAINDSLYRGLGQILSWPTWDTVAYHDIYLGLNDPDCPATVKELFTYDPEKAKSLLSEAGYPDGLKTSIVLTNTEREVDYYSVVKEQWSKANIELTLEPKEPGSIIPIAFAASYQQLFALFYAPPSTWPEQANYSNINNWVNAAKVNDPYIEEKVAETQAAAVTDFKGSMKLTHELMKYVLDQAYCLPASRYPQTVMWWPWLKAYSGELSVGYFSGDSWARFIWVDQALKKSMGR
jgi:peptide/nickel transport system substrate-binding protein